MSPNPSRRARHPWQALRQFLLDPINFQAREAFLAVSHERLLQKLLARDVEAAHRLCACLRAVCRPGDAPPRKDTHS